MSNYTSEPELTYRGNGRSPQRQRNKIFEEALTSTTGRGPGMCSCQGLQRWDGKARSTIFKKKTVKFLLNLANTTTTSHTNGSSTVKCANKTCKVQAHCSCGVGTLSGCNFHRRKYGIESMIIHGILRPK